MDIYKYPKSLRINLGKHFKDKKYLTEEQQKYLLDSVLIFEEKMDGKQTFIELDKYILWVEDLKYKHSIKYRVPARYALFDVYVKNTMQFLGRDDKINFYYDLVLGKYGKVPQMFPVPLVSKTTINDVNLIPAFIRESHYIDPSNEDPFMEGLVIKFTVNMFYPEMLSGKFVRKEFTNGITTNYLRLPKEKNIIDPSVKMIIEYGNAFNKNDPYFNSEFYKKISKIIEDMKNTKILDTEIKENQYILNKKSEA